MQGKGRIKTKWNETEFFNILFNNMLFLHVKTHCCIDLFYKYTTLDQHTFTTKAVSRDLKQLDDLCSAKA